MGTEMLAVNGTTGLAMPALGTAYVQQKGDSLAPRIQPGEWVEIDPNVTAFNGPGIYLTDWADFEPAPNYPRRVPQLRNLDYIGGVLHSVGLNPHYPAFALDISAVLIGGKVVDA